MDEPNKQKVVQCNRAPIHVQNRRETAHNEHRQEREILHVIHDFGHHCRLARVFDLLLAKSNRVESDNRRHNRDHIKRVGLDDAVHVEERGRVEPREGLGRKGHVPDREEHGHVQWNLQQVEPGHRV